MDAKRLLFLLLLIPLASAGACVQVLITDLLAGEAGINIALAISFTVLVIGIAYAVGSATNNQNLVVFSKDEIFHLLFSVFIIISISGILLFSCQALSMFLDFTLGSSGLNLITSNGCYTGIEGPNAIAKCYLSGVKKSTESMVYRLIKESISNEMGSTLVISLYNPVTGGVSVPQRAYLKAYAMQFDMIAMNFALPALISLNIQYLALTFSTDLIKWMLPIALLFRILYPTRMFGNILIAICIALYIIVPTFYALNGAMDQVVFSNCTPYSSVITDTLMGDCTSDISFWAVARALPQAFFLPNLTLALVVTFLGAINKALKVIG